MTGPSRTLLVEMEAASLALPASEQSVLGKPGEMEKEAAAPRPEMSNWMPAGGGTRRVHRVVNMWAQRWQEGAQGAQR